MLKFLLCFLVVFTVAYLPMHFITLLLLFQASSTLKLDMSYFVRKEVSLQVADH